MKTYIWSLPTRIFHFGLIIFVTTAFITIEIENLLNIHAAVGYTVLLLAFFRIIWAFMGPKYSRLKDLPLSKNDIKEFLLNIFTSKSYPSHNPIASWVMIFIVLDLVILSLTGMLAYGIQEGKGIFSFLNDSLFKNMELFVELHELFANLLLFLIFVHLSGIITDRLLHKEHKVLESMLNGYKNIEATDTKLNKKQILFSFILIAIFVTPFFLIRYDSIFTKSKYSEINYEQQNEIFYNECISCHTLYPPSLLPKGSWIKLMNNLENHFGDDASFDKNDEKIVTNYLIKNSADSSKSEASTYILNSLEDKNDIIAVTKTPYWIKKHKDIDKSIFKSKDVRSKANCKACHTDIEKGLIEDENIKFNFLSF